MLPIGPTPIFPKHLVVDVSNNVQTIDVHERNAFHFIAQALYQASHVQETIISWILIMAEYIMQTTIQAIFVLIQLSWFYCWKATIGLTKIDAWLVMIHSWYFDRDFHARSKHKLINEDQRKRPRRAIRKMFPGTKVNVQLLFDALRQHPGTKHVRLGPSNKEMVPSIRRSMGPTHRHQSTQQLSTYLLELFASIHHIR
jgi:hypothetical protein